MEMRRKQTLEMTEEEQQKTGESKRVTRPWLTTTKKTIESENEAKRVTSPLMTTKRLTTGDQEDQWRHKKKPIDKSDDDNYNKGWLSNAGKKRLNRQMRDVVRPVHVSALAYSLPDKSKKCCMTWREAISLHEEKTGKSPNWSSQFLQCKLCGKFFTSERNFETHYTRSHVDMGIYNQALRRLRQWDTAGASKSEVEWNIS